MIRLSIRLEHVSCRITDNYVSRNHFRFNRIGSGFQNLIHRQPVCVLVNEHAVFVLLVRNRLAQHGFTFWNKFFHTLHSSISCTLSVSDFFPRVRRFVFCFFCAGGFSSANFGRGRAGFFPTNLLYVS